MLLSLVLLSCTLLLMVLDAGGAKDMPNYYVSPREFGFALFDRYALAVEQIHHGLYSKALEVVKAGKDMEATPIFVCGGCGHTVLGETPDTCPICGAPKQRFAEIK